MENQSYIGGELELFQVAENWKQYYGSFIKPYLKGKVIEVGAGIGGTTKHLCNGTQSEWLCIEPDSRQEQHIVAMINNKELPSCCKSMCGVLSDLKNKQADAIIYIDVIEHIEDDKAELLVASEHLKSGGILAIVVPAHQYLYSNFDKSIGHYRRYSRKQLKAVIPSTLIIEKALYLDSVGLTASLAQKLLLKQSYPKISQIKLWDNFMVPISKITDWVTGYNVGKSVLLIARKK
jgi:SAM-dependent methyltransferase